MTLQKVTRHCAVEIFFISTMDRTYQNKQALLSTIIESFGPQPLIHFYLQVLS